MLQQPSSNGTPLWRYKQTKNLAQRMLTAQNLRTRYQGRSFVIIEVKNLDNVPENLPEKYIVPKDRTLAAFLSELRSKYLTINQNQAVFLFISGRYILDMTTTFEYIEDKYGDEDGFLYILISGENTFGTEL